MAQAKKNRWFPGLVAVSLIIILAAAIMIWRISISQNQVSELYIPDEDALKIELYYATANKHDFITKQIKVHKDQSTAETIRMIIDRMKRQPLVRKKYSWWPESLAIRSAYQRDGGLLILDFEKQVQYNQTTGAFEELLLIRSIVKTMVENFPASTGIQFLVGGLETETLAGHVDITQPLTIDMLY